MRSVIKPPNYNWESLFNSNVRNAKDLVSEVFLESYLPPPNLTVSQCAENYRILGRQENKPGLWDNSVTPYHVEIMDCAGPNSLVNFISLIKGSQLGGTEILNNILLYKMLFDPASILYVMPTIDNMKKAVKRRVHPMIRSCEELKDLLNNQDKDDNPSNSLLFLSYPGGEIIFSGANSASSLKSTPSKLILCDEVDEFPPDISGQGDIIDFIKVRGRTYKDKNGKIFLVSSPTIKGSSIIEKAFLEGDQRYYYMKFPCCGHVQPFRWKNLDFTKGPARMICEKCEEPIKENHKTEMMINGLYVPHAKCDPKTRSYHISSLYTPVGMGLNWQDMADQWKKITSSKSLGEIKVFVNTLLGETWENKGEAPEWERIYERRKDYALGTCPKNVLFLTAGADVHKDRIEVSVWGWGKNKISYLIDHKIYLGNPWETKVFTGLDELLNHEFPHELGGALKIEKLAIDNAYSTENVNLWASKHILGERAIICRGVEGSNKPIISTVSSIRAGSNAKNTTYGQKQYLAGSYKAKMETFEFLRLNLGEEEDKLPDGYITITTGADAEFCKQLVSESLVKNTKNQMVFTPIRERNEALDCRVYARAAASLLQMDKYTQEDWDEREKQLIELITGVIEEEEEEEEEPKGNWLDRRLSKRF